MGRYPAMKFRVSSNDFFRRTAIIVEVNDISLNKKRNLGRGLPADYWDFILGDVQQEENHVNRKVLSPVQVILLHSCCTFVSLSFGTMNLHYIKIHSLLEGYWYVCSLII
jgi:hypothetical protein